MYCRCRFGKEFKTNINLIFNIMKTYGELCINQKINFKVLLLKCGFKSLSVVANGKNLKINPINPIFDK